MPINVSPLSDISHVIQLAIAPVFLLTAIGTVISVLTGRLGRAVDRRRILAARIPVLDEALVGLARREVEFEEKRIRLIYIAISLAVMAALLVCALISLAFVDEFLDARLGRVIAALFVLSMLALIGSLSVLLREIFLAVNSPRAPVL